MVLVKVVSVQGGQDRDLAALPEETKTEEVVMARMRSVFPYLLTVFVVVALLALAADAGAQSARLNVNKATADQLAKAPGMNPELAKAVVAYRTSAGPLKDPNDLMKVPGMTQSTFNKLAPSTDQDGNVTIAGPARAAKDGDDEEEAKLPKY